MAQSRLALLVGLGLTIGACQTVGPLSIQEERLRYNQAIQNTAGDQLLVNIARVFLKETPLSLEVVQIVSGMTATGGFSGSIAGLGIAKKAGAFRAGSLTSGTVTPTLSYSEQPSVTYQPISGEALVKEFTTPVPISLITKLYQSSWPFLPLMEMITAKLTDNDDDYGLALDMLADLDFLGAVDLDAVQSEEAVRAQMGLPPASGASTTGEPDTLVIYFVPPTSCPARERALADWNRLLAVYPASVHPAAAHRSGRMQPGNTRSSCSGTLDADIANAVGIIALNAKPNMPADGSTTVAALQGARRRLSTYPAYGILKSSYDSPNAPAEIIQIIAPPDFQRVAAERWNSTGQQWYTLLKSDICSIGGPLSFRCQSLLEDPDAVNDAVDRAIHDTHPPYFQRDLLTAGGDPTIENNLNQRRRLIMIQKSETPPADAFRVIEHQGMYYFIGQTDYITQQNFALLQLLVAIQSVNTAALPTQSIPVGAH